MGTTDNTPKPNDTAKLTKEQRLAQAREYAKCFTFHTLSEEELKRLRRSAYAYII